MKNWNQIEIGSATSEGGVLAVSHPFDNLISTGISPWPTPEILQKLYESRQTRAFKGDQLAIVTKGLGYYSDLQSLHSEDALTWSVFGTVARADARIRESWLTDFLSLIDLPSGSAKGAEIFLWRRIPHPDTLAPGGPEIDFGILTENVVILGEAKWLSSRGTGQGKKKDKDQIQLRGEFLSKYGGRMFPAASIKVVVGVGLVPDPLPAIVPRDVNFRALLWQEVCVLKSHPLDEEVLRYFHWKKENIKGHAEARNRSSSGSGA